MYLKTAVTILLVGLCSADIYLHNPRGSNNRLNEKSANRKNANRAFDSQNNNRGGYNVGDATDKPAGNDASKQYQMKFFQSDESGRSLLSLEWTNQHGCGGNENTDPYVNNCNLVIQYACQPDTVTGDSMFRDGTSTQTQDYTKPPSLTKTRAQNMQRKAGNVKDNRVIQEPWESYDRCYVRERNKGLFTADQKLKTNNGLGYSSAIYTRQNPNGDRRGYECPEERDHYPYWHPTMWKDIAVLAENQTMCKHYQSKSFNLRPYHECVEFYDASKTQPKHFSRWNNENDCKQNGGRWTEFHNYLEKATDKRSRSACEGSSGSGRQYSWAVPYDSTTMQEECLLKLAAPECQQAPWTRTNHLGNGRDGLPVQHNWTLPYFPSGTNQRCLIRIRYNISTDDYDPYYTDSKLNGVQSPIQQNPYVSLPNLGPHPLRLAINTAQTGRVFQDRSHVFYLKPRPAELRGLTVQNLNVRGKRGNIVQVYPAVEYDFVPTRLEMKGNDVVHVQWTGSNTHDNGAPAGDGQQGDDGEGTGGTDRSNIVQIMDRNYNFPVAYEKSTMWAGAQVLWSDHGKRMNEGDVALSMASAGYYTFYRCSGDGTTCEGQNSASQSVKKMQNQLNNAPASFPGLVLRLKRGTHHYMCTRNNNFTNRSQKGTIIVR